MLATVIPTIIYFCPYGFTSLAFEEAADSMTCIEMSQLKCEKKARSQHLNSAVAYS